MKMADLYLWGVIGILGLVLVFGGLLVSLLVLWIAG